MGNSVIISFAYNFILRIIESYKNSYTCKLIENLSCKLKVMFKESSIIKYIKSNENISRYFEQSMFLRIIQGVVDWCIGLLRKGNPFFKEAFQSSVFCKLIENSLAGKLIGRLMERFVIVICFFIFIQSIVPFKHWHNQYGAALIILMAFLYVIKAVGDIRYGLDIKRLDFALILFFAAVVISTFSSLTPGSSIKFLVFNGMSFLLMLIIVNVIKAKEELGTIIYWIMASVAATCLLGFWQYINGIPVDPLLIDVRFGASGRLFSSMGNPNNYAEYLILTMPFLGAAYFNSRNNYERIAAVAVAAMSLSCLVMTLSRGSWIGLMVAVFVFVFFKNVRLIPLFLILGLAAIPFLPASITDRLSTIGRDSSSLYRIPIWKGSWRIVQDHWLGGIGIGPEPFRMLFNQYTETKLPAHSHMLPLQVWIELGLLGITSLVWLVVRLVRKSIACVFSDKNEYLNNIIIAGISSLAGIFTYGLVEYVWFYERIMITFWIVIAVLIAALNLQSPKMGIPLPKE